MHTETLTLIAEQATLKLDAQDESLTGHLIRSAMAGMYVGAAIVLIFLIGGMIAADAPWLVKVLMGVSFGGALTMVIFAGSELFTGSNLVLTVAVLLRRASVTSLLNNWVWTWIGNFIGSAVIAVLVVHSGVLNAEPVKNFILKLVDMKMNLPASQLFIRAILANWMVCLGVWMASRTKSDSAKILLIWWCMFTFITCGYEHSVANMTGLLLGLLLPHEAVAGITWSGYAYNLGIATAGNIVGGAIFVGALYWLGSRKNPMLAAQTLPLQYEKAGSSVIAR